MKKLTTVVETLTAFCAGILIASFLNTFRTEFAAEMNSKKTMDELKENADKYIANRKANTKTNE